MTMAPPRQDQPDPVLEAVRALAEDVRRLAAEAIDEYHHQAEHESENER